MVGMKILIALLVHVMFVGSMCSTQKRNFCGIDGGLLSLCPNFLWEWKASQDKTTFFTKETKRKQILSKAQSVWFPNLFSITLTFSFFFNSKRKSQRCFLWTSKSSILLMEMVVLMPLFMTSRGPSPEWSVCARSCVCSFVCVLVRVCARSCVLAFVKTGQ